MLARRSLIGIIILLLLAVTGTGVLAQSSSEALVRFVHTIPGASAIDVYVDNVLAVRNLPFGEDSGYISMGTGLRNIRVTPNGATIALWEQTLEASAQGVYTLTASTQDNTLFFAVYRDDFTALPLGKSRFTVIHAIPGAGPIDVLLEDGSPVLPGIEYAQPDTSGTLDVQVLPYSMVVVPGGESVSTALVEVGVIQLASGTSQMLLVYGTPDEPQARLLAAPTNPQGDSGFMRLVHGIPNGPSVDVYVNDTLFAILGAPPEAENATTFIAVPAGSYDVALRAAGAQQDLATAALDIGSSEYVTVVALAQGEEVVVSAFSASLTASSDLALLRVVNAASEGATLSATLDDGTTLASAVEAASAGDVLAIEPSSQGISLDVSSGGGSNFFATSTTDFNGGVFYDLLVLDSQSLFLTPISLAQSVGSVPGAVAFEPTPIPTLTPEPTVEVEVEAPQVVEQPTVPPPTPAIASDQPIGRVFNLNPDANLQLRRYPDTQAESLGLLPFGATVLVNGREGELIPNQPATPIPPDYEYIDPVTLLEENQDLSRDATWLNITYITPDGGSITAWARSDFIDVRDATGKPLRLRDLDTVPGNLSGDRSNTQLPSPVAPENVVTILVVNLNPNANLNIRRTPSENGEVLEAMVLGTTTPLLGVNRSATWAYVSYNSAQGCIVEGWVNTEFVQYQLNSGPTDLATLAARGLPAIIPDDRLAPPPACNGAVQAPIQATPIRDQIIATVALDPGANLNMRRDPQEISAVITQIPSGTQLVVNGRSGSGNWLLVTYNSVQGAITGWVAAQQQTPSGTIAEFVQLTFNGRPFSLADVPLADGQIEEPTATPTLAG